MLKENTVITKSGVKYEMVFILYYASDFFRNNFVSDNTLTET